MSKKIAVIGAGPMGLAVAYQLACDGYEPVIYEADDRIGGMSASFDFDGLKIERYYHFHCITDSGLLEILKELNLEQKMLWTETRMGYWYQDRVQAWGNPVALLKFKGLGIFSKIRYGLFAFLCTKRHNWKPLDKKEATTWIKQWVGRKAWDILWRPLFELKLYQYADKFSAAWIWSRIHRIGCSRYSIFREKLGYIQGGSETLLETLKTIIEEKGGVFKLSMPISKVVLSDNHVTGVETKEGFEKYDKVISTIPLPYIPQMIPELPEDILEKYRSVDNLAVVCIIVKLRKKLTENFWLNINDPTMDIPGLVEYTNLCPLDQHVVYAPYYVPGDHPLYRKPDEFFVTKIKKYLIRINPNLEETDILGMHIHRYLYAQPVSGPNFLETIPPTKLPVQGLWVADTSYYYPFDRGISESIDFGRKLARGACLDKE